MAAKMEGSSKSKEKETRPGESKSDMQVLERTLDAKIKAKIHGVTFSSKSKNIVIQ